MTMSKPTPTTLTPTPGQTVGPFYGYALPYNKDRELLAPGTPGSIRLQGEGETVFLDFEASDAEGAAQ